MTKAPPLYWAERVRLTRNANIFLEFLIHSRLTDTRKLWIMKSGSLKLENLETKKMEVFQAPLGRLSGINWLVEQQAETGAILNAVAVYWHSTKLSKAQARWALNDTLILMRQDYVSWNYLNSSPTTKRPRSVSQPTAKASEERTVQDTE